jgi:hypothetical protein
MKSVWPVIYLVGGLYCVYGGFVGPLQLLSYSDIDWVAITVGFVMTLIMPLGLFAYAAHYSKKATMQQPSFDRHPFGWWTDVLQPLRVSVLGTVLQTFGFLMAFFSGGGEPPMVIYLSVTLSTGIVLGERLVYRVYKARIAPHRRPSAQPAPLSEN